MLNSLRERASSTEPECVHFKIHFHFTVRGPISSPLRVAPFHCLGEEILFASIMLAKTASYAQLLYHRRFEFSVELSATKPIPESSE